MLLVKLNQKRELVAFVHIRSLERGSEGHRAALLSRTMGHVLLRSRSVNATHLRQIHHLSTAISYAHRRIYQCQGMLWWGGCIVKLHFN